MDTYSPSPYSHRTRRLKVMIKTSDLLKKFGKRVRDLRIQRGINSQMALGIKCDLDRTYIGGIERGERNVALKNIEKIAEALDVSLSELMRL